MRYASRSVGLAMGEASGSGGWAKKEPGGGCPATGRPPAEADALPAVGASEVPATPGEPVGRGRVEKTIADPVDVTNFVGIVVE